ncbi:hypothetical protein ACFL4T_03510 [candidate division KSB1 bacterium]
MKLFRKKEPKNLSSRVEGVSKSISPASDKFRNYFTLENKSDFYRYIRERIPNVGAAIWVWCRLCSTPARWTYNTGKGDKKRAENILDDLSRRIYRLPGRRRNGISTLIENFFLDIFTTGRFAGELIPLPSGKGIDKFRFIDPFRIEWKHEKNGEWTPYFLTYDKKHKINKDNFFYYGLGSEMSSPGGSSWIDSIPFVIDIEQKMLEDMGLSSHNAGVPRLHIKISKPEPYEFEKPDGFIARAEKYFDETLKGFSNLEADDNIFTWNDVEISVVGGEGKMPYNWRVNREQVIEDVITGMKLFPWVVGRSHGTTKNWVYTQFNILMQAVDSIQEEAKGFAEWILNTELKMRGLKEGAVFTFEPNQDPNELEKAKAESIRFSTLSKMVEDGFLTKDELLKRMKIKA